MRWSGTSKSICNRNLEAAPAAHRAMEMASELSPLHILAAWQIAEAGFRDEACDILEQVGAAFAAEGTGNCDGHPGGQGGRPGGSVAVGGSAEAGSRSVKGSANTVSAGVQQ